MFIFDIEECVIWLKEEKLYVSENNFIVRRFIIVK